LSGEDRRAAAVLHRALREGRRLLEAGERDPSRVEQAMAAMVRNEPRAVLDYAVAVDASTLRGALPLAGRVRLLVAATIAGVRLIDNEGVDVDQLAERGALFQCAGA
jgi:pantoate--beta-alanine ligase